MTRSVHIHYHRPPDRTRIYVQDLVLDASDVKISLQRDTPLDAPLRVDGRVVLEAGSPVVWFTFPGRWYDVGRFHTRDGVFTGWYGNLLTPPELHEPGADPAVWRTTDLFLDVWLDPSGDVRLLDEDEWEAARARGDLEPELARRAHREAQELLDAARRGLWPPPVALEWTLERALAAPLHPPRR